MPVGDLDPRRTALLVIDMQNAFAHPEGALGASGVDMSGAAGVIERTRALVKACKAAGVPVLWSIQEHLKGDAARKARRLGSHTAKRVRVPAEEGTWDAELVEELAPLADEPTHVFRKHRFGCFHDTVLTTLLRARGIDALLVTGATANACVETTLREAYLRDLDAVAVTDCIIGVRQDWYETTQQIWRHYLCELATSDDVRAWLEDPAVSGQGRLEALEVQS
jgi:ureidoacrylate peracid hydrolase